MKIYGFTSGPPEMGFQALGARRGLKNVYQPLGDGFVCTQEVGRRPHQSSDATKLA
jgi:hypothetical protein